MWVCDFCGRLNFEWRDNCKGCWKWKLETCQAGEIMACPECHAEDLQNKAWRPKGWKLCLYCGTKYNAKGEKKDWWEP